MLIPFKSTRITTHYVSTSSLIPPSPKSIALYYTLCLHSANSDCPSANTIPTAKVATSQNHTASYLVPLSSSVSAFHFAHGIVTNPQRRR